MLSISTANLFQHIREFISTSNIQPFPEKKADDDHYDDQEQNHGYPEINCKLKLMKIE